GETKARRCQGRNHEALERRKKQKAHSDLQQPLTLPREHVHLMSLSRASATPCPRTVVRRRLNADPEQDAPIPRDSADQPTTSPKCWWIPRRIARKIQGHRRAPRFHRSLGRSRRGWQTPTATKTRDRREPIDRGSRDHRRA